MKGLLLGCLFGVPKTWVNSSRSRRRCGTVSNEASKLSTGREPRSALPVSLSSSDVWTLSTWNFADGPWGTRDTHRNTSSCFRTSKNTQLFAALSSAISFAM
eukprot:Amastigsp_a510222_445.p3 type:complete len:102 gc:universal Amastigsp_a510222_445:372-677(+)